MRSALTSCGCAAAAALLATTVTTAGAQPLIQNGRVTVWDVAAGAEAPRAVRDVVMFLIQNGQADVRFQAAGTAVAIPAGARAIVIELQDTQVAPLRNTSGHPPAFPRSGSVKVLENARVVVWQSVWTPGVPTPLHFHDKDVVVTYLTDAAYESTDVRGQRTPNEVKAGTTRFNPRDRTHVETLLRGEGRAVMVELK
jgi:tagatose-1,6-bisphosphate aldolase non-catalytic subunit AgaZ/GatZ